MIASGETRAAESAAPRSTQIVVIGLGNPIRTDDGVGVHAMRRLAEDARLSSAGQRVSFIDAGMRGLALVNDAADASHVLILDAIDAAAEPGTLVSLNGSELASMPGGCSVHQLGISDWIGAVAMMSGRIPEIRLLGIQPLDIGWGTSLTPVIELALDRLVETAMRQLAEWMTVGSDPADNARRAAAPPRGVHHS